MEAKVLSILGKIEADYNSVTPAELREITTLSVTEDTSLTALKDGDFNDLTSLRSLYLDDNRLRSLPSVMFDNSTSSPAWLPCICRLHPPCPRLCCDSCSPVLRK